MKKSTASKHSGKPKVYLGMSGGVDSTAAALILKKKGYSVTGITFELCGTNEHSEDLLSTAEQAAKALNINWKSLNLREEFEANVIEGFVNTYLSGQTPNPCICCNKRIKFDYLLDYKRLDLPAPDFIATGHYARIEFSKELNRYLLKKASSEAKDQSYFLYNMTQEQLSKCIFPLADYEKDEIRQIASEAGLMNASKKDSQDVCFIPNGDYASFIKSYTGNIEISQPGNFEDLDGNILGTHKGFIHYTVGQRKGLGLSLKAPMYVHHFDFQKNAVVLATEIDLYQDKLTIKDCNWIALDNPTKPFRAKARIRYRHKESDCTVYPSEHTLIVFDEPQRAITKGQSCVIYDGDIVIGGGIIM